METSADVDQLLADIHTITNKVFQPSGLSGPGNDFERITSFWSSQQHSLKWHWDTGGVIGLHLAIRDIAHDEIVTDSKQDIVLPSFWTGTRTSKRPSDSDLTDEEYVKVCRDRDLDNLIQGDQNRGSFISDRRIFYDWFKGSDSRVLYYLSSLPDEVMSVLLTGTLPKKMQDRMFASKFRTHVKLSSPGRPGTYALYLARSKPEVLTPLSPADDPRGYGLSVNEWIKVCETGLRYIDIGDGDFTSTAKRIDTARTPGCPKLNYKYERRYGGGGNNGTHYRDMFEPHLIFFKNMLEFFENVKQLVTQLNIDETNLDLPLDRCPVYMGMSTSALARAPEHWAHKGAESPLFGLLTALVQHLWPDVFDIVDSTFQVFRTVRESDNPLAEILSCYLTSSYRWFLGGTNYTPAGAGSRGGSAPDEQAKTAEEIRKAGVQKQTIESSVKKIQKFAKSWNIDIDSQQIAVTNLQHGIEAKREQVQENMSKLRISKSAQDAQDLEAAVTELEDLLDIEMD